MSPVFRRGQLYWAEVPYLPERPLDILGRGRQIYPTDFLLMPPEGGLKRPSVVFLNQLRTLHKNLIVDYIGELPSERMAELNVRLAYSLGLL